MPNISSAELARRAYVSRQSMNMLLRTLDQRGLVQRATIPALGRVLPTTISPTGRELIERVSEEVDSLEHRMTAALTGAQVDALREALRSCQTQLGAASTPDQSTQ